MEIVMVGEKLKEVGLSHPRLNALQADDTLYTVLAFQPEARIRVTENSIGHFDSEAAKKKTKAFFALIAGMENQPDLVVSPEYSVPWDALIETIEEGLVPEQGKLWVLGCESLLLGQLQTIRERLSSSISVLDDETSPKTLTTQRYRNPLVYVFWTDSLVNSAQQLVMLVQYKTEASGDAGNTEATGMLPGKSVYLFGNATNEVRLISLICSDVFGFSKDLINEHYDKLLLLHVQLNLSPRHLLYKKYRAELFESGQGRTELICLNWAENIAFVDAETQNSHEPGNVCGSAWYLVPPEFDTTDETILKNHQYGVYYTYYKPLRIHTLIFDAKPRIFFLQSTKVFHHAVPKPRSTRHGPKAIETFVWSESEGAWLAPINDGDRPNDGFQSFINRSVEDGIKFEDVLDLYRSNPLSVERAMAISTGDFGPNHDWHKAINLDSMCLCQEEIVRRMTVIQDREARAESFRSTRLAATRMLAALRRGSFQWPASVEPLNHGFKFNWMKNFPNRNVQAADGSVATVVFAGAIGDLSQLESLEKRVRKTLAGPPQEPDRPLSDDLLHTYEKKHYDTNAKRFCILVSTINGCTTYQSGSYTSFTNPDSSTSVDISQPSLQLLNNDMPGNHR